MRVLNRLRKTKNNMGSPLGAFEILAHRGLARQHTENTLEAFASAIEAGAHWLETDVRTTRDGVLVAFHDSTLNRLFGTSGKISETTWDQLKDRTMIGGGRLLRFADLLAAFPRTPVNVDVKDAGAAATIAEVTLAAGAAERVRLASFSEKRKAEAVGRALALGVELPSSASEVSTALFYLCSRVSWRLWPLVRRVSSPWVGDFQAIQVPVGYKLGPLRLRLLDPKTVEAAHRFGIKVHVWTIDDPADMRQLLDLGVDGIVTNRPDVLAGVLVEREPGRGTG